MLSFGARTISSELLGVSGAVGIACGAGVSGAVGIACGAGCSSSGVSSLSSPNKLAKTPAPNIVAKPPAANLLLMLGDNKLPKGLVEL